MYLYQNVIEMARNKKHAITPHECRTVECLKRHKHHDIVRKIHKKRKISYKTLFYMREYGKRSHVAHVIMKESIKILLIASIISSLGGVALDGIKANILTIIPLLIMLPALTDMIGDMGTVASSKFTHLLYFNKVHRRWWASSEVKKLFTTLLIIVLIAAFYVGLLSYGVAVLQGFAYSTTVILKVIGISVISAIFLFFIIFAISVAGGLFIYSRHEDPNNFLIPITTSVADFGSLLLFSYMVLLFF